MATKRLRYFHSGFYRVWGQDPTRHGRTFKKLEEARAWAEAEAPLSCGYAFVHHTTTDQVDFYSARTQQWS